MPKEVVNIPPIFFPSSVMVKKVTAADTAKALSSSDIPFFAVDIQCQDNGIKLGVGGALDFVLYPNETYWTYNANLRDFNVINETAGSNGAAIIIATIPNKYVNEALKLGFSRGRF